MPRKRDPDCCPVCNQFIDVVVCVFQNDPFYDGRKYSEICFTCLSVVKSISLLNPEEENDSKLRWKSYENEPGVGPIHLHTVEEMEGQGWTAPEDKAQAKKSIAAVKAACRKRKVPVARINKK